MTKRIKLDPALKNAIAHLSSSEKDKLIFRLLPKNAALVEKLTFELLEEKGSLEARRTELKNKIIDALERYQTHYYSPGYLLMLLRDLSGAINRHVKTTKDRYGEIELNYLMLNQCFIFYGAAVAESTLTRTRTFNLYVVKRVLKLLSLAGKLHEDYLIDFVPAMQELAEHFNKNPHILRVAENEGLNIDLMGHGFMVE